MRVSRRTTRGSGIGSSLAAESGSLRRLARGVGGGLGAAAGRGATAGAADSAHLPSVLAATEEPVAAVGLETRHMHARRHHEPLQDLSRSRIDSPHIALVAFPGGVPDLAVHPADPG